jgi:predicted dehydrogenase
MPSTSRRKFLQQSARLGGGSILASIAGTKAFHLFSGPVMPSDKINIGAIGINGMGWSNVLAALKVPGVTLTHLCDVDSNVLNRRMADLQKMNIDTSKILTHNDHRKLLDQKDVDAVIIATPDHWHALQMVDACKAGKDVYVEKPVGNSITECRIMVAAQQKYGRIVQAGQWQRSQQHFKDAIDMVHSGQLGKIRSVKVWSYVDWKQPLDKQPNGPVPAGVDYTRWLGPAQSRPFNPNRFHFTFRWFWDYAGGLMTDWGVHLLDYALIGMKATTPLTVSALGGNFAKTNSADETPDTLTALYQFKDFNITWEHAVGIGNGNYNRDHGIAFIGNAGTLVLNRNGWEVVEEKKNTPKLAIPFKKSVDNGLDLHMLNFITAVKEKKSDILNCPIQAGADIAIFSQMGNIAYRSGQKLSWDAAKGKFTDEAINQQYLAAKYHNGYQLPGL